MPEDTNLVSFKKALSLATGGKKHLLLGNGFSIGANEKFRYGTLYQQARSGLSKHVHALFKHYGTTNFEEVLRYLSEGIWLADHYKLKKTDRALDMERDHEMVKDALVNAVASIHPASRNAVADEKLRACNVFLDQFNNIFTTNYDLLLYWAILVKQPPNFKDGFWVVDEDNPNFLLFDNVPTSPNTDDHFIYFLHGALHLYATRGQVRKVVWGTENPPLIDQIKEALTDDRFPLIVSEGDPEEKKERIEGSGYLSACRRNFRKIEGNLFVFGSRLGKEDIHILQWIAQNRQIGRLFVGVHGDPHEERNQEMITRIRRQVDPNYDRRPRGQSEKVVFYDSDTANVWASPPRRVEKVTV